MGRKFVVRYDDEDWVPPPPHDKYRGGIRQKEMGDESERKHWQAYVEFEGAVNTKVCAEHLKIPWVKKGQAREHSLHLAVARGTREENAAYCGSSLYCHTHRCGDFKWDDLTFAIVPNGDFC